MKRNNTKVAKSDNNVLAEIQKKFTQNKINGKLTNADLLKILGEVAENVNIIYPFQGHFQNHLKKSFFERNEYLIIERIRSNKKLITTFKELAKLYAYYDADEKKIKTNPEYDYIVISTEDLVKNLVSEFLSLEIDYLIHLKTLYKDSYAKTIHGNLLNLDLRNNNIAINEKSFTNLLDNIGIILKYYFLLLRSKNAQWLNEFVGQHRSNLDEIARLKMLMTISKKVSHTGRNKKRGRKGLFESQEDLHQAILKIPGWNEMSLEKLSIRLGLSKNRLGQILKENNWSRPKKD